MKTWMRWTCRIALHIGAAMAISAGSFLVQGATLGVGDPAPELQVARWIQGEPVREFARDKAYLVEFWATWCGPCRVSIPHLNEIHTKFEKQGLVVIGQDVLEQDPEAVAAFVKRMGPKMTYRVALDTADTAMERTWMTAAGQEGIPTAFLVDKSGRLAWIGHPMALPEDLISQVLEGRFDLAKATEKYRESQRVEQQTRALWKELSRLRQDEQWTQAQAKLTEIEKLLPAEDQGMLDLTRFELWLHLKQYAQAYQLAERLSDADPKDAGLHNQLAWTIATQEGIEQRNLDLAEKLARRAFEVTQGNNAEVLDTLARVLFLKGDKPQAIAHQTKAVELAESGRKKQFQRNLDDYKADRLPNEVGILRLRRQLDRLLRQQQWDQAQATLNQLDSMLPVEERDGLGRARFNLLVGRQEYDKAYALANRLSQAHTDPAMYRNDLTWAIAIQDQPAKGALELAEKIARDASQATQGANAEILDTLARLLFLQGRKEEAVAGQRQAVEHASGQRKTQFQATLDSYLAGQLPKPY